MIHHKKETLIYIEPRYYEHYNKAIVDNYHLILGLFNKADIPFIYLPKLMTDIHFNKVLKYNHPYLKDLHTGQSDKLYHIISSALNLKLNAPAFVYLSDEGSVMLQFDLPSPEVFASPEKLNIYVEELKSSIDLSAPDFEDIRFRSVSADMSYSFDLSFDEYIDEVAEKKTPDDLFAEKAFEVPDDLQKQIEELKEAGHLSHLIKYLEILQQTNRKLSRLKITEDYRLYLMDYEMKEVKMSPLPKALFLLFLKHPRGISFKELPDYRSQLLDIYNNISLRENPLKARQSIIKLTNPLDNSVHEKCSRIRAAFLSVVAEDIAESYYITGGRGEVKRVLLDRELVIYQ